MLFEPDQALGDKLICFTSSIYGGVSKHNYFSLNLGAHVGDHPHHVERNRALLNEKIAKKCALSLRRDYAETIKPIKWLQQEHTNKVSEYSDVSDLACDGIYTSTPYTPLAIMTADCMPIVLYSPGLQQLAVLHAGWRGLLDGIVQAGLAKFLRVDDIKVWIGPSISQSYFEVSHDVIHHFDAYHNFVKPSGLQGKWKICLASIANSILQQSGVNDVQVASQCTYQNKDFFSHRRAGHIGFAQTGRMATVAMIIR